MGKTEVAKIIAKNCAGEKPITLNMSEFYYDAGINRIIGSPAGYLGSDSNVELPFDKLKSNPYQVILLDEFESATDPCKDYSCLSLTRAFSPQVKETL